MIATVNCNIIVLTVNDIVRERWCVIVTGVSLRQQPDRWSKCVISVYFHSCGVCKQRVLRILCPIWTTAGNLCWSYKLWALLEGLNKLYNLFFLIW